MSAVPTRNPPMEPFIPARGEWPCQYDPGILPHPRLVAALYRIMRDHLPTGVVEQILIDVRDATHDTDFTNEHLRDLAFSHAGYLTSGYVPHTHVR